MRMNSCLGKRILALIREGNYAHPGEAAAIELVFQAIEKRASQTLLDVGCGRGGTAAYLQAQGWGQVTGLDIDPEAIADAQALYPDISFYSADVIHAAALLPQAYDLIYLFNSFYAFPDQAQALNVLRQVAQPQSQLLIFDYTDLNHSTTQAIHTSSGPFIPHPIQLDQIGSIMTAQGWQLTQITDISPLYRQWYQEFLIRAAQKQTEIIAMGGALAWETVQNSYSQLLGLIEQGILGGAILTAMAI